MKSTRGFLKTFLPAVALAFFSTSSMAAVTEVGQGAFSPGTVIIDFDDYATGNPVIPGITVSGAGSWSIQDGSAWGGTSNPLRQTFTIGGPIELTFDSRMTRVGFVFGGNTANNVPFETRRNGVATGNFTLISSSGAPDDTTNWYFVGYEDPEGIDSIWFDIEQTSDWVYGIYDLALDDAAVSTQAIPAMSTWSRTLVIALFLLVAYRLFRRRLV